MLLLAEREYTLTSAERAAMGWSRQQIRLDSACMSDSPHLTGAETAALGWCRQQDRLDWMYQGSMMAKAEAQQRQEEAMLEGKPVQLDEIGRAHV